MSDILNKYPVFESNQVLTSTQLNNLVNYLDQQNRLTRAKLIGMGVVCGLETSYDSTQNELTISRGTGITSEGYLVNLGECVTTKYRPYTLPVGTIYEPFVNSNNEQDITLFELLTDEADSGPDDELLDDETFLSDKIVLLFIESFDKDLKSCLGKSCDELGKERTLTLRKLLISITDLETVWNRTNTGKLDAVFPEKFDLPVINLPRVLFDPAELHSSDYTEFSLNYAAAVQSVFTELLDALSETYDIYRPLFLESYDEQNPFETQPVSGILDDIDDFLTNSTAEFEPYFGIQYVYDLFQDLILAYNEFKNTAFDLMSECCPDMSRFPKHLMLGEAIPAPVSLCESSEYRHYFIQPPVYNLQKKLVQETIALHNRMVLMLESFDLERINGLTGEVEGFSIRITPSREKKTPLSLRSIPWYYDVNLNSGYENLGRLKDYWSFEVSRKCPLESDGLVLNYEDQSDDQSVAVDKLSTPLFYDIQDYPFLRIEGQIGTEIDQAIGRVNELKKQFNLPFDVVNLQLDSDAESLELDYSCGFEDIQEEYQSTRAGLCGIITDLGVLYDFVKENQDLLFDSDEEGDEEEILELIAELLGLLKSMCAAMEECVEDFEFETFQANYKETLEFIIDFILLDLSLLDQIEIKEEDEKEQIPLINGMIQRLSPLVFRILDMFFYSKLLRIYYSFKRREFYLKKETAVFSNFIDKHPGIDHQGGVPKGGTFILVSDNSESNTVVADFNLPYMCCGSNNCVPMCEDGSFEFDVVPFARPDYAVTTVGNRVDIDVMINDYQAFGGEFIIDSEKTSEFGGGISQASPTGPLRYKPKKDFVGVDTFVYNLINKKTGERDVATVTILVKEPDTDSECYSIPILECWGQKEVMEALQGREIEFGSDDNIFQLLLDSLRNTAGFTSAEIRTGVLRPRERKINLLNCLGIQFNPDAKNEELSQLIEQYQIENCGGEVTTECYTREILDCWGVQNILRFLEAINVNPEEDPTGTLLAYLRKNRGFSGAEIDFMLEVGSLFALLSCIFPDLSDDIGNDQMRELLAQYQAQNCQGSSDNPRVKVNVKVLEANDLKKVLTARGETVGGSDSKTKMENSLKKSKGGVSLTEDEMLLLSKKSISNLLDAKKIGFTTSENKKTLIKKLF